MGNRAVITTERRDLGVYLHWNGGRDSVEAFLKYCELRGFRSPDTDEYGWARLCQVVANFMGADGLSVGISRYTTDRGMDPGDNGIYVIEGWRIAGRVYPYAGFEEQDAYPLREMLLEIDRAQPEGQRLGGYLAAREVPVSEVRLGDLVYFREVGGRYVAHEVVGFGEPGKVVNGRDVGGRPYVAMYDGYMPASENCNNYVLGDTARLG